MQKTPRRILGIDPGFGRVGVGIIEERGREWVAVYYGCIQTDPKKLFIERLLEIHNTLTKIITQHKPAFAAVEELFFYKNVTTAIQVGQARGVILLTLAQAGIVTHEFTPLEIKQTITGYGRAEKSQIQKMVRVLLHLDKKAIQDDAADALAVALTGATRIIDK
ncbi:MAG: crossover junction endodeoxyribonuclease RuvC [Candidatus Magasanikbacteria bacterium RIFCSPHIGHO2_01_FULL_41_23]|uniref:Crossover junction endodeoxyribonuclease RuvC n=1 Tax=Candidatus Magasanikbacteria bacterium RIFCSPLOWO2_01_FULL_40_15 TaxID=1798686 RepID=A0A1F6N3A5_9BACT|nr:MAG: crossover junction endodeoxyribonuclease RuvC [Candidatus Magasanikbacteria bacterium RIFCSPHIGHO2_01_FULL_41_23]OGH67104.1 MAG: crossover junction endodeoxyribonuclease RuvC [Candidatus Magasanikbacteria bacterium RIFCSPHIGHO2_02_FULL_41_35]OGH76424.1 MAG: crossover junction endodeoxyribonuclease RuvC [Candidatus Magasanikbacteria bacterium RIFCSPHIGHO2_12_FULL_41_16]OGH78371.1 MAG: crossover junction endodeoxyribonuclease RuvC [Candidatus Magasanikbacteria bacterium RIFCSPLOWO2_01_FULL